VSAQPLAAGAASLIEKEATSWSSLRRKTGNTVAQTLQELRLTGTVKRLNVEHRTSNIEHRILMTLRFIDFKTSESQNPPKADKFRRADPLAQRRRLRRVLLNLFLNRQNTLFDVRRSMFDVRCSLVSFSI
jgi:hypothetical protein